MAIQLLSEFSLLTNTFIFQLNYLSIVKQDTRLLEIIGDAAFDAPLNNKKDPNYQAMVKMGYYQPINRCYVFSHDNGGIDIVQKKEQLVWCHNHFKLTYTNTSKDILHPTNPATKIGNCIKPMMLLDLVLLYNREHNGEKPYAKYVERVFPQFTAWLRTLNGLTNFQVSVEYLLCNKLYSEEKFAKKKFSSLWYSTFKLLKASGKTWKEFQYYNKIAKKYPEINNYFHGAMKIEDGSVVYTGTYLWSMRNDTMRMCEAYGLPFKFTWSDNRVENLHNKLHRQYTKMVAQLDNRPLTIAQEYAQHDWAQCNTDEFKVEMLTTTGQLAEEGLELDHCVATYASNVNNGSCIILRTEYQGTKYTAEVSKPYVWGSGPQPFMIRQYRGLRNQDAPTAAYACLQNLINTITPLKAELLPEVERVNPYLIEPVEQRELLDIAI